MDGNVSKAAKLIHEGALDHYFEEAPSVEAAPMANAPNYRNHLSRNVIVGVAIAAAAVGTVGVYQYNNRPATAAVANSMPELDNVDGFDAPAYNDLGIDYEANQITIDPNNIIRNNTDQESAAVAEASSDDSSTQDSQDAPEADGSKESFEAFHYDPNYDPALNPNKEFDHDFGVALDKSNLDSTLKDWQLRLKSSPLQMAAMAAEIGSNADFKVGQSSAAINKYAAELKDNPTEWEDAYKQLFDFLDDNVTSIGYEKINAPYSSLYIVDGEIFKTDGVDLGGTMLVFKYKGEDNKIHEFQLRIDCGGQNIWGGIERFKEVVYVTKTVTATATATQTAHQTRTVTVTETAPGTTKTRQQTVTETATQTQMVPTTVTETHNGKGAVPVTETETVTITITPNGKGAAPTVGPGVPTNG